VAKRFSTRIHPSVLALQQELAELSSVVEETVVGHPRVKGFAAEPLQGAPAAGPRPTTSTTSRLRRLAIRSATCRFDFPSRPRLVMVLWYGGHQVLDGHLSIGELVAFNAYVLMLVWPLRMTGMLVAQAQRAVAASQRIDQLLSTAPPSSTRRGAPAAGARPPADVRSRPCLRLRRRARPCCKDLDPRPPGGGGGRAGRPHRLRQETVAV